MPAKKWTISYTPLRSSPNGTKIQDIPTGATVVLTGEEQEVEVSGRSLKWEKVTYRGKTAWVQSAYLEELVEKFSEYEVQIPTATEDETDAAQYMILNGDLKYNMCGQLCAAFIGGDDIITFVEKWKETSPVYYNWTMAGDKDQPTGLDVLMSMLKVYGYRSNTEDVIGFGAGLTDPVIGLKLSPGRIQKLLENYYLIVVVRIDRITGKIRPQGIGHWVVVDKVQSNGINSGWVELYNPFTNKRQEYSYDEFITSCNGGYGVGVWVKRLIFG
jgi:hypothetical protein